MLYNYIRLIYSDNGTLADKSLDNQDESSTLPLAFVASEDYLYIAQSYPFNNFFYQMLVANSNTSALSVEYWTGRINGWISAVDILDGTSSGGKTLARSGVIQFSPDPAKIWMQVRDSTNETMPTGLETLKVYNVYWIRIKVSANLSALTAAKRLCYAFTRSQQLDNIDITINDFLETFGIGKTDWDDQIITASLQLVNDLRRRGLIIHAGSILRFEDVTMACDYRTLILIYKNLGPGYKERLATASLDYNEAIDMRRFSFDTDENAFLSTSEKTSTVKVLER